MKYEELFKIFGKVAYYVLGLVAIVWGVINSIQLVQIYTAESTVIGSIKYEESEDSVFAYDFGKTVAFYPNRDNTLYSVSMTTEKIDFNGSSGNQYALYLNDRPCDTISVRAGLVQAKAVFEFYATDSTTAANLTLDISLSFYSDKTVVNVSTTSGAAALGYFVHMTEAEGFVLDLRQEITLTEVK